MRKTAIDQVAPSRPAGSSPVGIAAPLVDPLRRRTLRSRLKRWYVARARSLPWRKTSNPYHIWVSEVMLQQTQVSTVVPYYLRFIERFPTLTHLAVAGQDEVLKLWQGLGYYRRAINLHRAARDVLEKFGGRVPADDASLRRLPGVGRYIAAAVRSIAFGQPAAIVEANTARVLCRLFALRGPLAERVNQKRLWELSELLMPRRRAGMHNQAMMELGALVCVSGRPRCDECPVSALCAAKRAELSDLLPESATKRGTIEVHDVAGVVWRRGRVLIVQRPLGQRWGGLWELPRVTIQSGDDPQRALQDYLRDSLGLEVTPGPKLVGIKHSVTHHRITLTCYECAHVGGSVRKNGYAAFRWESPDGLRNYPLSSPQRRLIAAIERPVD